MQYIDARISDKIIYITLNRPDVRNALNQSLIIELTTLLQKINNDDSIHAVCLLGANHFFCAGADLEEMKTSIHLSREENIQQAKYLSDLLNVLYQLNKPTVAMVEGGVYGGGLGLVACCDIVLSSDKTQFCFSETKLGLIPAIISPYVIKAIGKRQAKRFFLTAEVFDADTAKEINLVHKVVPSDRLLSETENQLKLLLKNSLQAMSQAKKLFSLVSEKKQTKLIELLAEIRTTPDAQKRLSDFLDAKGGK